MCNGFINIKKSLLASFFIHIFFLIYFNSFLKPDIKAPNKYEVTLTEKKNNLTILPKGTTSVKGSQKSSTTSVKSDPILFKPSVDFSKFNEISTFTSNEIKTQKNLHEDSYSISPNKDDINLAWGIGGGTFERVKDYTLYKKIYNTVEGILFFPSFFKRQKISGTVNARLVLNEQGTCNWYDTKIHEADFHMRLYVLSVLKKTCEQNFKPYLKERLVTVVDLSFMFEFGEVANSELKNENTFIIGNALHFYRSQVQSSLEWELGPFKGMFPLPAVYMNLPWIQENWDRIVRHKNPEDFFKKEFGEKI